jgi:tetratricopeptide (TPR) repeat protein
LLSALRGEVPVTAPAPEDEEIADDDDLASQITAETVVPPATAMPQRAAAETVIPPSTTVPEAPVRPTRRRGRHVKKLDDQPAAPPTEDPSPATEEQRRAAAGQFERAVQVLAEENFDYGISLLLTCCRLDPTRIAYRKALREAQWQRFEKHPGNRWFTWVKTMTRRMRLRRAKSNGDYARVLQLGEELLTTDPADVATQLDMADAAESAGFRRLAIWILHQARAVDEKGAAVNRALAVLYEKDGEFTRATEMWEHVLAADRADGEARQKIRDLSARETIARGRYYEEIAHRPRTRKDSSKL